MSRAEGNPKPQYAGMTKVEKTAAYTRAYYAKNKEKLKEYGRAQAKKYRKENRELVLTKKLNQWLRDIFKRSTEWYEKTLAEQGGHCALCETCPTEGRRFQVDHDHECCPTDRGKNRRTCGKCIRGLLCEACNTRLGYLEAILKQGTIIPLAGTWLYRAVKYLETQHD